MACRGQLGAVGVHVRCDGLIFKTCMVIILYVPSITITIWQTLMLHRVYVYIIHPKQKLILYIYNQ